jgi:alpha-glucuronidase
MRHTRHVALSNISLSRRRFEAAHGLVSTLALVAVCACGSDAPGTGMNTTGSESTTVTPGTPPGSTPGPVNPNPPSTEPGATVTPTGGVTPVTPVTPGSNPTPGTEPGVTPTTQPTGTETGTTTTEPPPVTPGTDPETYPEPTDLADEDGSDLWLRYPKVPIPNRLAQYQAALTQVVATKGDSDTLEIVESELVAALSGLTGNPVAAAADVTADGAVVAGTPTTSTIIAGLSLASRLAAQGDDGYIVEATQTAGGQKVIAIAGNTEVGVLYGTFALLRHLQMHKSVADLKIEDAPKVEHRLLNHWDNLDGTVERGYAGRSLWDWSALPGTVSPRFAEYARANASVGINGAALTNVNANAQALSAGHLDKVKVIADIFRPYGIKVYLTARFSAPSEIGGLSTSDPNDAGVKAWWVDKANEIYEKIPDFGGFLVKANSEGQPGPQDYDRTHADGANTLAAAVAPHGGIVMWRAFVYSQTSPVDRIKQAYDEFHPLDGQFDDNVLVQVKNGPLDFQPREPFSPLFGNMPGTPLALEVQLTKEYLGEDTHLAYLGSMWEEVLKADTFADGEGSSVARVIDGTVHDYSTTVMAGVANIGKDANWTGSHFNQANWYAFGRLAWDPDGSAEAIADEWVRQTFSNDPVVVEPVVDLMMQSHQAVVDYMTPLGLAHIMAYDHHYGPGPWLNDFADRPEWNPVYYHKADENGLGFDRTAAGSNAVAQYFSPLREELSDKTKISEDLLLFFHHVGWEEPLSSGRPMWEELVHRYSLGVDEVGQMRDAWATVSGRVDGARFDAVDSFLEIQHYEARWWRDACLTYFSTFAGPLPAGYAAPANALSFYQGLPDPSDLTKPRMPQVYTGNPSPAITE